MEEPGPDSPCSPKKTEKDFPQTFNEEMELDKEALLPEETDKVNDPVNDRQSSENILHNNQILPQVEVIFISENVAVKVNDTDKEIDLVSGSNEKSLFIEESELDLPISTPNEDSLALNEVGNVMEKTVREIACQIVSSETGENTLNNKMFHQVEAKMFSANVAVEATDTDEETIYLNDSEKSQLNKEPGQDLPKLSTKEDLSQSSNQTDGVMEFDGETLILEKTVVNETPSFKQRSNNEVFDQGEINNQTVNSNEDIAVNVLNSKASVEITQFLQESDKMIASNAPTTNHKYPETAVQTGDKMTANDETEVVSTKIDSAAKEHAELESPAASTSKLHISEETLILKNTTRKESNKTVENQQNRPNLRSQKRKRDTLEETIKKIRGNLPEPDQAQLAEEKLANTSISNYAFETFADKVIEHCCKNTAAVTGRAYGSWKKTVVDNRSNFELKTSREESEDVKDKKETPSGKVIHSRNSYWQAKRKHVSIFDGFCYLGEKNPLLTVCKTVVIFLICS